MSRTGGTWGRGRRAKGRAQLSLVGSWFAAWVIRSGDVAVALVQAADVVLVNRLWDRFRRQAGPKGKWRPWRDDEVSLSALIDPHFDLNDYAVAEAVRLRSGRRRQSDLSLVTYGNGSRVFEMRCERISAPGTGLARPVVVVVGRDVTDTLPNRRPSSPSPKGGPTLDRETLHDIRNQLMGAALQAHLIGADRPCRALHADEAAALSALLREVAHRLDATTTANVRAVRARSGRGQRAGMS